MQKKLDIIANEVLIEANQMGWPPGGHGQRGDGSHPRRAQPLPARASFLLLFDPLDGSSNIDVNVSIGTIFSVLKMPDDRGVGESDFYCNRAATRWRPATASMARRPRWC